MAWNTMRPMRPKPLIPILMATVNPPSEMKTLVCGSGKYSRRRAHSKGLDSGYLPRFFSFQAKVYQA
jgi:hypothetical protein